MNKYAAVLYVAFLLSVPCARSDDLLPEKTSYVAALAGVGIETSSGSGAGSSFFSWSAHGGTDLYAGPLGTIAIGLAVQGAYNSLSIGSVSASSAITLLSAEILNRKEFGTGLYTGTRLGVALGSVSVNTGRLGDYSASATAFVIGPVLGYELPISPILSVAAEASWMVITSTTLNFPTLASFDVPPWGILGFQAGISYHWR